MDITNHGPQITAESASKSIRDLISINEFPHSWGQNSIVGTLKESLHLSPS